METPATRRLVLCLDGTWNNAERGKVVQGGRTRFEPTNVLKMYRAVLPVGPDGTTQIAYYNQGVGAFVGEPSRLLRLQTVSDRLFGYPGRGRPREGRARERGVAVDDRRGEAGRARLGRGLPREVSGLCPA